MACPKPKPFTILLVNTLIVGIVFALVDFVYYGLINPGPIPYGSNLLETILFTLFMAMAFAHLYNKVSHIWAPNSKKAFVYKDHTPDQADECKATWPKILNGMIFSFLTSVVIIMAIELAELMVSVVYVYLLDGIRGDYIDDAVITIKVIIAGTSLELKGRTEDDPG